MKVTQFGTTYDVAAIDSTHVSLCGDGMRKAPYHVQQLSHFDDFERIKAFATAYDLGMEEINEEQNREEKQIAISDLAEKFLDEALASGEAFSEGLCNWSINKAERVLGST